MGRIYGWLMICGAQQQSLTELAAALGVSKASISTVIRPMEEAGLALRLPAPGRQHSYRVAPGGVTRMLQVQFARMRLGAEVAEFGLSVLGKDRAAQRERLAERDGYRMLGTSVTAPGWLEQLPNDRPTLVIAEGLLPYLAEAEARTLLQRVTDRFPAGELMFDGVAPWAARLVKLFVWGLADPHLLERWNPRLRFVAATSAIQRHRRVPARFHRLLYRLGDAIRPMREFNQIYRYSF